MTIIPQCMSCRHLEKGKPMRCTAFPKEIPMDIALNKVDHRERFPGDHGIRFNPLPGEHSPFEDSSNESKDED